MAKDKFLVMVFVFCCLSLFSENNSDIDMEYKNSKVVFDSSDIAGKPYSRIPALTLANNGNILAACEKRALLSDNGEIDILLARSTDNGNSFSKQVLFSSDAETGRKMNPCFLVERTDKNGNPGRIYCFVLAIKNLTQVANQTERGGSTTLYKYSDDNGITWSKQYEITTSIPEGCNLFGPSPTNGIELENGTWVIPGFVVLSDRSYRSGIIYKTPDSDWKYNYIDFPDSKMNNECTIIPYGDGNQVFLNARNEVSGGKRYSYYSEPILSENNQTELKWNEYSPFSMVATCEGSLTVVSTVPPLYLYSFPVNQNRSNIGIFSTNDLINFRLITELTQTITGGYSVIAYSNNKLFVIYESDSAITECRIADLTDLLTLLY